MTDIALDPPTDAIDEATETDEGVDCDNCGNRCAGDDLDNMTTVNDDQWCESCTSEHATVCDRHRCGAVIPNDDAVSVDTGNNDVETWCPDCADRHATRCGRCSDLTDDTTVVSMAHGRPWCTSCYENHGSSCDDCGDAYSTDDLNSNDNGEYCAACWPSNRDDDDDDDDGTIGGYHSTASRGFKPIASPYPYAAPLTYRKAEKRCTDPRCGDGVKGCGAVIVESSEVKRAPLLFGLELEIESKGRDAPSVIAAKVKKQLGDLFAGAERDGSLDNGVECITQPATIDKHRAVWASFDLRGTGAQSHDTTTCGLHVHCTRSAVSDLVWAKVTALLGRHQDHEVWSSVFRRGFGNYNKTCSVRTFSAGAKHDDNRYRVVNTSGKHTVEIRWPKGTLRGKTIVATLECIHALIRYCETASTAELTFTDFVAWCCKNAWARSETKVFRSYLAEKRLIVAKDDPTLRPRKTPASTDTAVDF